MQPKIEVFFAFSIELKLAIVNTHILCYCKWVKSHPYESEALKAESPEYQYLNLLQDILDNGADKPVFNNPGVYIRSVFGRQMRFDLSKGFPLLTTKKVFLKGIIYEL